MELPKLSDSLMQFLMKHIALPNVLKNKAPWMFHNHYISLFYDRVLPKLCLTYVCKMVKHDKEYEGKVYYSIKFWQPFRSHTIRFTAYGGFIIARTIMEFIKSGNRNASMVVVDEFTGTTYIPSWAYKYVLESLYTIYQESKEELMTIEAERLALAENEQQTKPTLH